MEIVAVSSAIYGLVLSMLICILAVGVFTGHGLLLLITIMTMIGEFSKTSLIPLYLKSALVYTSVYDEKYIGTVR